MLLQEKETKKKTPALSLISLQTTKPWLKNHFNMTLLFLQINRYTQVTVVPHFVYSTFLFWTQFSLYIYTSTMTIKQFYWCHCTLLLTPTANPLQKPLSLTVVWGITLLVQKTNFFPSLENQITFHSQHIDRTAVDFCTVNQENKVNIGIKLLDWNCLTQNKSQYAECLMTLLFTLVLKSAVTNLFALNFH